MLDRPSTRLNEYYPSQNFPRADDRFSYFYFCKNESDEYIDLYQRISPFAEITPIPNFYPYDSTINVKIKVEKNSIVEEWLSYVLPYKAKAMACIMGIPIQTFLRRLINCATSATPQILAAVDESIDELMSYFGQTKDQLYVSIMQYYGSDFAWQSFKYTQSQYQKYKSPLDRPAMLPRRETASFETWQGVTLKAELQLYELVKAYYPDAQLHYTASWLERQHLDIYSEIGKIAFEYQGEQHYKPIEFWGGEDGLQKRLALDAQKRERCKCENITLVEWEYTKLPLPIYIIKALRQHNIFHMFPPSIYRSALWEDMSPISKNLPQNNTTMSPRKKSGTIILRVSKRGEIEREYLDVKSAAEDTSLSIKGIQKAIYGERKTCGGYIWVKCSKNYADNSY